MFELPILLCMTEEAPEEGAWKQTQALELLQLWNKRQRFAQFRCPSDLPKHKWKLEINHSPGGEVAQM